MNKKEIISIIKSMNKEEFEDFSIEFEDFINTKTYHEKYLQFLELYNNEKTLINLHNLIESLLKRDKCIIKELRLDKYDIWCSYDKHPTYKSLSFSFSTLNDFVRKHN